MKKYGTIGHILKVLVIYIFISISYDFFIKDEIDWKGALVESVFFSVLFSFSMKLIEHNKHKKRS